MVLGFIPVAWSMGTNPHLETTVRIQKDRGHKVATTGPYNIVRHPMYLGGILQSLSIPLFLGSAWTLIPAGIQVVLLVIRTTYEDRTLQDELEGYKDYSQKTRYRLMPGVW